ncbi:MAG: hypothetical protein M3552_15385 [Planctomycetota bacterium]|nr:hypothetical protein [Planctomycetota bacterium]
MLRFTSVCLSVSVALFGVQDAFGSCPGGGESTLAKTKTITGHSLERWADYPWSWPECYQFVEVSAGDNQYFRTYGNVGFEQDNSCGESDRNISAAATFSVTFNVSTGGNIENQFKLDNGLSLEGLVSLSVAQSVAGSVNWQVSGTFELTATGTFSTTIPGGQYLRVKPYISMTKRKLAAYEYAIVDVYDYCTTHSVYSSTPYYGQVDYDSMVTDVHVQADSAGTAYVECPQPGCGCAPNPFPSGTYPISTPPPFTFTPGLNWFDDWVVLTM